MLSSINPSTDGCIPGGAASSPPGFQDSYLKDITPASQPFRMRRSSAACETCKKLKIRCNRDKQGMPCVKCRAFKVECRTIKAAQPRQHSASVSRNQTGKSTCPDRHKLSAKAPRSLTCRSPVVTTPAAELPMLRDLRDALPEVDDRTYLNLLAEPGISREPITATHTLAYLGEPCSIALLGHESFPEQITFAAPTSNPSISTRLERLDRIEVEILIRKGALLLPPTSLCDELVESYFTWIHPIVPVLNRAKFMRQYGDPNDSPSLLLLQAVLLAASRVSSNPLLRDANGSTLSASTTFYKRAKALYDANFENDRVTAVQASILIGWHWDGSDDVMKNAYYWGRVAIIIAQDSGMHRSVQASQLSIADKKIWKRIWWTVVTRDRSIAVAFGRPVIINLDDCDVETLTVEDLIDHDDDDETNSATMYIPDPAHVHFFLRYVELSKITGRIQTTLFSAASVDRHNSTELLRLDKSLTVWLRNCPDIVFWPRCQDNFWASLLHLNYHTAVCMVHRFPLSVGNSDVSLHDAWNHPSRDIAFHAASMITFIVERLAERDQLRYCPAYIVHILFSAVVMHVYQMRSPELYVRRAAQGRLYSCMQVTKKISNVWLVGKMVHKVLEFVVDNKLFEEHLRKAKAD